METEMYRKKICQNASLTNGTRGKNWREFQISNSNAYIESKGDIRWKRLHRESQDDTMISDSEFQDGRMSFRIRRIKA